MSVPFNQSLITPQAGPQLPQNIATSNETKVAMAAAERLPKGKQTVFEQVDESQAEYTDSSSALFSLYLSHAEKYDRDQSESWKAGADGILVFTGLFAAALAPFVIDSYKLLLPDSAGNTVLLLTQISQQLEGPANGAQANIPPSTSIQSTISNWKPPASAIWINVLWFLSLVISLFCALLATLQQRWARQYLRNTQSHFAIHKRALIRSFFAEGVTHFHLAVAVEAIPALLHVSVFLFLAGLVISLFNIHHTVAFVVLAVSGVCVLVYTAITLIPAVRHNSPYTSPFSTPVWYISRKAALVLLKTADHIAEFVGKHTVFRRKPTPLPLCSGDKSSRKLSPFRAHLSQDMTSAAYHLALTSDKGMIARALGWTLDKMDEEGEMAVFAAGIPGFSHSTWVEDAGAVLEEAQKHSTFHGSLYRDITSLLIRSAKPGLLLDSKLLPESVRQKRIQICLEALYFLPHAIAKLLQRVADQSDNKKVIVPLEPLLQSVDSWLIAERLSKASNRIHQDVTIAARCVAAVLATQVPNDKTELIVMRQLKIVNRDTLYHYAILVHNLRLKSLNNLLENTALKYIEMDPEKFPIIVSAARLVMKKLEILKAQKELRDEYVRLLAGISSHLTGSENASRNAKNILSVLPRYPLSGVAPDPAIDTLPAPSARPPKDTGTTATAVTSLRASRNSPPVALAGPSNLQPMLQGPIGSYILVDSPTRISYPSSPNNDTYP